MAVAAPDTALPHSAARSNVAHAIKDAVFTALISFALLLPLIGFKTVQNMRNELELETRMPLLLAIVAIITAGRLFGSLPGAVLGGLLIGLIETLWSAYFSIDYKDVATFSILAITLVFMPSGLLGRPDVEKV